MKHFVTAFIFLLCSISIKAQTEKVTVSGQIRENSSKKGIPLANVLLKKDSAVVQATISGEDGRFVLNDLTPGNYLLAISATGYEPSTQKVLAGTLNAFLDLGNIELIIQPSTMDEVVVSSSGVGNTKIEKQTYSVTNNVTQAGGSLLQAMKNLPGITIDPEGKLQLRGSDKVTILIDGKQTALTGFGNQAGLDNIPASAIERIEIINNPSAKYDANGAAGIINIIYKKNRQAGWNGKIGLTTGLGALWQKKENLPGIRPQYQRTPKYNPTLSLNYRKNDLNFFLQGDWLYTKTLNKNEFVEREYDSGDFIRHQIKRNRITTVATAKTGIDWTPSQKNNFSLSALASREQIKDYGDIPYFNKDNSQQRRLWQFFEDELVTAVTVSGSWQHKFRQPGHLLNAGVNYTYDRENEKYFLTNTMPAYTGRDTFKLIADQHVLDAFIDYVRPLKHGRIEAGAKFRNRNIPTNMRFLPGINSPLDVNAGGWAEYREIIPALYSNYIYESNRLEAEAGVRMEYVRLRYLVNPDHNTYSSDGYNYLQPFPNVRIAYKVSDRDKLSLYYNRRVDRPDEGDIRIFPKYDDPEILKVGNPGLRPQFTQTMEAGYKTTRDRSSFYTALYFRSINNTITRIGTLVPGDPIVYNIFQNAGKSYNYGIETSWQQQLSKKIALNFNGNIYKNVIDAFTVENKYPVPTGYAAGKQDFVSGNIKMNLLVKLSEFSELQLSAIYLAPDIIPQGKIQSRFSIDAGFRKQWKKGEIFANITDMLNTYRIKKRITGDGFRLTSTDYYETQVFRIGYNYKF